MEQGLTALGPHVTEQVSADGDVVYGFDPDFRNKLRSRSLLIAAAPQLRRLVGVLLYITRVAFGTALIASVALVWLAITVLLNSRNDDRDDRRRGGGVTFYMNPLDLFLYWDPYYARCVCEVGSTNGCKDCWPYANAAKMLLQLLSFQFYWHRPN